MVFQLLLFLCSVLLVQAGKRDYVFFASEQFDEHEFEGIVLEVVDFSTPSNPVKVSSILLQRNTTKPKYFGYKPSALVIDDTVSFAYLYGWGEPDVGYSKNGTLWVVEIKEASLEVKSVTYNISCANSKDIPLVENQGYLYILTGIPSENMYIFDVRNPTAETLPPPTIWQFTDLSDVPRIQKFGNYLYVMVGNSKLEIVDLSNPASPSSVRLIDDENFNAAKGFTVTDKMLVLNYPYHIGVFDLSDATNPSWVEHDDDDEVSFEDKGVGQIWSNGKFIFVLLADCPYYNSCYYTLQIFDFEDMKKPKLAGYSEANFNVGYGGSRVQNLMRGNYVYMNPNALAMNVEGLVPTVEYAGRHDGFGGDLMGIAPCPSCPFNAGVTLGASFFFVLMCTLLIIL